MSLFNSFCYFIGSDLSLECKQHLPLHFFYLFYFKTEKQNFKKTISLRFLRFFFEQNFKMVESKPNASLDDENADDSGNLFKK